MSSQIIFKNGYLFNKKIGEQFGMEELPEYGDDIDKVDLQYDFDMNYENKFEFGRSTHTIEINNNKYVISEEEFEVDDDFYYFIELPKVSHHEFLQDYLMDFREFSNAGAVLTTIALNE